MTQLAHCLCSHAPWMYLSLCGSSTACIL